MVRLRKLTIRHMKNIGFGTLLFNDLQSGASITGIYGQNGSGKTTVVDALGCVKLLMQGGRLPEGSCDLLQAGSDSIEISARFDLSVPEQGKTNTADYFEYAFTLVAPPKTDMRHALHVSSEAFYIRNENTKHRRKCFIRHELKSSSADQTSISRPFSYAPEGIWKDIREMDDNNNQFLILENKTFEEGSSFIFSLPSIIKGDDKKQYLAQIVKNGTKYTREVTKYFLSLLTSLLDLKMFAFDKMFVIPTSRAGVLSIGLLTLTNDGDPNHWPSSFQLDLSEATVITDKNFNNLKSVIKQINEIIPALVPGLRLELRTINKETMESGDIGYRVEILSVRDGKKIPFRCESEGIKKLVSILKFLSDVFNNPDSCIIVDELDSGIFEYLLGKILEVVSQHGKGQLIFTAHNLRALEMLPVQALIFSTANPENRFIPFKGTKRTNNLRDQYFRTLNLGGQNEELYQQTDEEEIRASFYRAGKHFRGMSQKGK